MKIIYQLEAYQFDHDYWTTIGVYSTKEEALKAKEKLEEDSKMFCSIFEKKSDNVSQN